MCAKKFTVLSAVDIKPINHPIIQNIVQIIVYIFTRPNTLFMYTTKGSVWAESIDFFSTRYKPYSRSMQIYLKYVLYIYNCLCIYL